MGYPDLLSIAESYLPTNSPYVLLGESFSGPISVKIASRNPAGLKGLILVNTFLKNPSPVIGKIIRAVPDAILQNPSKNLLNLIAQESEPGVNVAESLQRVLAKVPPKLVRARLGYIEKIDVADLASRIGIPTMILRSGGDWLVPKKSMQLLLSARPEVLVKTLPGNHFLLQASPKKSAEEIAGFCKILEGHSSDEA